MGMKIPNIINSEEYGRLLKEIEKGKFKRIPRKRLQQYKVAIILGMEAGMRISEVIGLHSLKSRCCREEVITKRDPEDKKKKNKYCVKCEKLLTMGECYRDKIEWQIKPLAQENINDGKIEIRNAKNSKDRIIGLPKRITERYIKMLPLKIQRRALQKFTTDICQRLFNKHLTYHSMRHSFGSEFQRATGDIRTLQVLMGHSSIATTQIYSHVNPEDAIKKQMQVFGGGTS